MIPTSTLTIKWTFPFYKYIKTEQIASFEKFEEQVNQFLKVYEYKVIPLMRQGEKCYKIQKPAYKQKIKQKFKNLQAHKTELQNDQSWSSLTSSKKDRKASFTKKQDILMEFRYKQEHEQTMKIQEHCKLLEKTYKQITDKMEMAQKYQTYFNHLRHIKYENKAQCDNDMVTMKIYFLVSEPLVRIAESKVDGQVKHLSIMRQSIKIHEHMQKIKQLHEKNRSINLKFQKVYISHEKLLQLALKLEKQPEKDVDLIVLQVYTQLYEQNNQFYVCLQSQNSIGLQNRNVTLNILFEVLNKISKLHCIVLVGPNMRKIKQKQLESKNLSNELKPEIEPTLKKASSNSFKNSSLSKLKKKQWHMEAQVPIVVVGVFDAEKDIFFTKVFMQVFYSNLFNRHTVSQCCEQTNKQLKKVTSALKQNNNIAECCCMHGERMNPCNWNELEQRIGLYTIHKIFSHQNYKDYSDKLSNDNYSKEIVKLVLNIEHPDTTYSSKSKELAFKCEDDAGIHRNNRCTGDFLKYNIKTDSNLLPKREKTIWEFGKLLTQKIQDNRYSRFRPLVLYNLITKILMKNTLNIIIIKGCSKSGKTQFITLAECYVSSRTNRIKFRRFRDWLKIYRENKSIQAVKQIMTDVFEQNQQKSKIIPQKLVLSVGKVYYEVQEQYEHFLAQIIGCQQIVKYNIVILSALGDSQNIHNEKVQKYVTKFTIPSIKDSQMKYLILRDQQTQLKKDPQDIYILNQIIKQFRFNVDGQTNIRSQIHYSSFCKQLRSIIEVIKSKKIETQQEMQKATSEQMKKYINKTKTALDELKYSNKQIAMEMSNVQCTSLEKCSQVWADFGFFCSFRQGFFLCDFNKPIALLDLNLFQQISKKQQFYQIRLYRISTNNKERQSVRQQKSYSIRPQMQCFYYFNEKKKLFRQRKINYFFNFYYLVYKVIRKSKDKFSKLHERIFENYGIFMYDFQEDLQSVISLDKSRKEMLDPQYLQNIISDDGTEQRNFIYNTVVQKHIYIFIEFLKEINGDWKEQKYETLAQEQKSLLLIIQMASICHRNLDHVLGSKKQQLNEQIKKFVAMNQQSTKDLVVISLAQTCAIIDYQNLLNVQNMIKNSQNWGYKDIMRILANLQLYQINKRQIQNKIKYMNVFLSTENLKIQDKEEELNKFAKQIQINMTDTIQRIKFSIEKIQLLEQIRSRHYQCILDIILTKILIKFKFFNNLEEQNSIFNSQQLIKILKQITENIKKVDERYVFRNYQIRTCFAYLKTKINLLGCKDTDISPLTRNLSEQFLEMYQYVKQKLNPKTLFQSCPHIALFMKAGCLKVLQKQYNYVRMNNIISKFLKKKLGNKQINLLFLNLSQKNFQMVVEEQPIIDYFILTVDCYENSNKNLYVVLQDNMMSCKLIDVSEFLIMLKKIKFRFLILSGSYSHKLCDEIKSQLNPEMIAVIALTFNKQQLDLSTYPISQGFSLLTMSPIKVVQDFIKVQNTQRILEMTICSILTYLTKKQREFKPNKDNIEEIVKSAIKVAADVLTSWYKNKMKQFQNIYQIRNKIYVNDNYRIQFPYVPAGELKNLSSQVIAIPSNFNDDSYYENVGRIQIIAQIMKQLSNRKLKIVQIAGGQRSGKTQILKQVGWFCRTRKIFQSGVYRYDIKQLIDNKQLKTIIKDLNRQYPSNKNLLVLMDNLQIEYLQNHAQFFQNFFEVMSTKPVSLVYTVSNSPNCSQSQSQNSIDNKNKNNLINKKLTNYIPNCKLYGFRTFDANKLSDVEKICIALINFRNRGKVSYVTILETYFPDLYNLSITKNDSSISLNKKIPHAQSLGAQKTKKEKQRKKNKNKIQPLSKKMRSDDGYYEPPSFNKINSVQNDFEKNKKQKQGSMLQNKNRPQEDEIGQQSSIMDYTQNNDSQMQISQQIKISKQIRPAVQQIDLAESKQIIEDPNEDDNSSQKQSKISGLMLPLDQPSKSFISSIPIAPKKSTNDETPLYTLTHTSSKSQQLSDLAYILEMCKLYKIRRTEQQNLNLNSVQRWFNSQQEVIQPQEIYEQNYLNFDIERMQEKLVQGEHNWLKLDIQNRALCRMPDFWKPL